MSTSTTHRGVATPSFQRGEAAIARALTRRIRRRPAECARGRSGPQLPPLPGLAEAVSSLHRRYGWRTPEWREERVQDLLAWLARPESAVTLARSVLRGLAREAAGRAGHRPVAHLLAWRLRMQVRTLVSDANEKEGRRAIPGARRVPLERIVTRRWDPAYRDLADERLRWTSSEDDGRAA